ncbi:bifunctional enzyme involved in thiolation and methylation of tRNA [Proteiniborus sp. DW1]|uniref:tRNA (N6-isopentenyl adenosine(37)-C2)-methylthiotransferase MiaB n=1 Tax=Proteiniborus sp. DW1 TaxID=1889883 RepID=UPI00092E0F59|nr:tRNA (N6-isopentenyl adenosine(37)-C2)-methylthiotransferase MiaB [Proteiniborus sp. DW1]SCG83367.1 bifunctional enzyme involved in thiolation and methylation of tRNA [Proteiniborus sp. DW1]
MINGSKKYIITTWGCQMNEHDSEKMSGILETLGYISTDIKEEADLIIFNTCLVRENAELKVYGNLGELKALKRHNPDLIIAICGCMMQKKEIRDIIKEKYKFVDIIFGTHNIHKLPELIANHNQHTRMIIDVWEDAGNIVEGMPAKRKYGFKAFVNIMYGCNNFCSYCIVPYTRGREKSREPEDILSEIRELANEGCKEITLLGQNVNSYGKTLTSKMSFAQLLYLINEIEGIERIRFMTSHPKDLSDELIYTIRDCHKVCEHIHLPFQAGSNRILKHMNRKYTKEQYLDLVKKIKSEIPNISLTTDIIVGFPGETEEDFMDTIDVVKKSEFDSAFTFIYSIREGTPAANMENQIPEDIKHRRLKTLLDTLNPISHDKNLQYLNTIQEVLVEETSKTDSTVLSGRTRTSKLVHFKGDKDLIGKIVKVKIDNTKTWTLEGMLIDG